MDESRQGNCSKCIVFMHEMPFTMATPDFFLDLKDKPGGRSTEKTGSKLNLQNNKGAYRFSRLFRKAGIRLVIGGHKHTFTLSNPLYDAPEASTQPDGTTDLTADSDPFISEDVTKELSYKPFIEMPMSGVLKFVNEKIESDIKTHPETWGPEIVAQLTGISSGMEVAIGSRNEGAFITEVNELTNLASKNSITSFNAIDDQSSRLSDFIRIRFVNELNAPTYVMSQATGYKVVSNKELPSATSGGEGVCRPIPWLLSYCAAIKSTKSGTSFSSTKNPV